MDDIQNNNIEIQLLNNNENHTQQQRQQQSQQQDTQQQVQVNVEQLQQQDQTMINYNGDLSNPIDQKYTMSQSFTKNYNATVRSSIMMVMVDIIIGYISLSNSCQNADVQSWNAQWGYLFIIKAIYHILISIQYLSERKEYDICNQIGELRTYEQNLEKNFIYGICFNQKQRDIINKMFQNKIKIYYYQRTFKLKFIYFFFCILTVYHAVNGMLLLFHGNFYTDNKYNSDFSLWIIIILLLVIGKNIQPMIALLDIILKFLLSIPGLCIQLKNKIQIKKQNNQFLDNLQKIKYHEKLFKADLFCSICQMEFIQGDQIAILPCSDLHHFHEHCIKTWISLKQNCPMCRTDFSNQINKKQNQSSSNQNNQNQNIYP